MQDIVRNFVLSFQNEEGRVRFRDALPEDPLGADGIFVVKVLHSDHVGRPFIPTLRGAEYSLIKVRAAVLARLRGEANEQIDFYFYGAPFLQLGGVNGPPTFHPRLNDVIVIFLDRERGVWRTVTDNRDQSIKLHRPVSVIHSIAARHSDLWQPAESQLKWPISQWIAAFMAEPDEDLHSQDLRFANHYTWIAAEPELSHYLWRTRRESTNPQAQSRACAALRHIWFGPADPVCWPDDSPEAETLNREYSFLIHPAGLAWTQMGLSEAEWLRSRLPRRLTLDQPADRIAALESYARYGPPELRRLLREAHILQP